MAQFLSLSEAKSQLNVTADDQNALIEQLIDEAEALVLERCNSTSWWRDVTVTWTDATIPFSVRAAMLMVLTYLFRYRGDDTSRESEDTLWMAVDRRIAFNRDPVLM